MFKSKEAEVFRVGVLLLVFGFMLDLLSTIIGTRLYGLQESNPFVVDPETGRFLISKFLIETPVYVFFRLSIIATFVRIATKEWKSQETSWALASLPFYYQAWYSFTAVTGNILQILSKVG